MKIGGIEVKGLNEAVLVLTRDNLDTGVCDKIVIKARAVADMDEFDKLVPEPKAPGIRTRDGWKPNIKDETYRQRLERYNNQRLAYMIIRSLEPSEIEWEEVSFDNPSTWLEWDKELRDAGFSDVEINRVVMCVMQANALDEDKLKVAREVFLLGQGEEQEKSSGPNTEQASTQSGNPANDLELDPQK